MAARSIDLALDSIQRRLGSCWFAGGVAPQAVEVAEGILGVKFPPSYRQFVERFGAGNIGSEEIYGLIGSDLEVPAVPNAIWMTLDARQQWPLPDKYIVMYFDGMGNYFVIDTSEIDQLGESPVMAWEPGSSTADGELERISPSFGEFLLSMTERELG